MDNRDLIGVILLTFAIGVGLGYYVTRIIVGM